MVVLDDSLGQSDDNNVRLSTTDSIHHYSYYQPAFYYPASWTELVTITSQIPGADTYISFIFFFLFCPKRLGCVSLDYDSPTPSPSRKEKRIIQIESWKNKK